MQNAYRPYRPLGETETPMVVKNLLIINVLFFLAKLTLNVDMDHIFGLHFPTAPNFRVWQPITYLFMHADITHIFFNMFGLWMFGRQLENYWGPKRFLIYYLITGIGAAVIHYLVLYFTVLAPMLELTTAVTDTPSLATFDALMAQYKADVSNFAYSTNQITFINEQLATLNTQPGNTQALSALATFAADFRDYYLNMGTVVVGASGALFGILLAFGMLFPNTPLMLLFFPVPIKAKYIVIGYGVIELFSGLRNSPTDNVAHFAHLGGMLFGFILIKYWNNTLRNRMY